MARSYRYLHYDVFTDRLFGGNQLAVFLDARGLTVAAMQAIANEMNFSESTFVLPPETPDSDFRLRIFTPTAEMPMAGHPTIGSAYALARCGAIEPGRDRFVFGLAVGPTPVSLTWKGSDLQFAWMTQQLPQFAAPIADRAAVARSIGLAEAALAGPLPVQVVSCGVPFLLVPLDTRRSVDAAVLSVDAVEALFRSEGADPSGVFLFSLERGEDQATAYSRMFAPLLGVAEDPATGSASGPLGCYLVRHKAIPEADAGSILSLQGVKMGRPSHVHVSIGVKQGDIAAVRVGGEAVLAGEGTLYIS